MRIAISLMEDKGKDSEVAEHPGNAKFIAVYDSKTEHFGSTNAIGKYCNDSTRI